MPQDKATLYWMWYRGIRRACGEWYMLQWQQAKKRYFRMHPSPPQGYLCSICEQRIIWKKDISLDHIIPIHEIYTRGLPVDMLFGGGNLTIAHKHCNTDKGHKVDQAAIIRIETEAAWREREAQLYRQRVVVVE